MPLLSLVHNGEETHAYSFRTKNENPMLMPFPTVILKGMRTKAGRLGVSSQETRADSEWPLTRQASICLNFKRQSCQLLLWGSAGTPKHETRIWMLLSNPVIHDLPEILLEQVFVHGPASVPRGR